MDQKYDCAFCHKRILIVEGDIKGTLYCPFCRRWNICENGTSSQGQANFENPEDIQYYDCVRCEHPIMQFEGDVFFRVKCQKCTVLNEYPSRNVVQAKKAGYNISRYLRQGRTVKTLKPKSSSGG